MIDNKNINIKKENIDIALLGFGTVGKGVWDILSENKDDIFEKCNKNINVKKILVRDKEKYKNFEKYNELITDNPEDIFNDDKIRIVVELMGGSNPAKEYIIRSMGKRKHIVTANKLLIATYGEELFESAKNNDVSIKYEASVGGGIPIIQTINDSLSGNKIQKVVSIINGTTNYILSKMSSEGYCFEDALKEAQKLGFAEADPTSDIEGFDALYKLSIIAGLSFNTKINIDDISREGISKISKIDIEIARKLGYVIKPLAIAKEENNILELKVYPAMVPMTHPIANVNDSYNAVFIKGNAVGDLMLYGRGAGDLPTGSSVVSDIISTVKQKNIDIKNKQTIKTVQCFEKNISQFYIRLEVKDQPGVLAKIAKIFGENDVSICTVNQETKNTDVALLVLTTHEALEGNIKSSINEIEKLSVVESVSNIIRIEDFK